MKTRRIFRYIFSLLLLSGFFRQLGIVQGQASPELTSVKVGLVPEYNQVGVLVVLNIEIAEEMSTLQTLTFQIPSDGESLAVSRLTPNGALSPLSYESSENGSWKDIQFTTDSQTIQIEYIDPNLIIIEDHRYFELLWRTNYPVESLSVTVRQPRGAGQILAQPALDQEEQGPGGATYFTREIGPLPAEELFSLKLMYTQDNASLAYPALEIEAAQPVNDTTPGRTPSPLSVVMWLLTVAIAVLLLVSLYYWWFKANIMEKREGTAQGVGILNPEKQAVYCHECGKRSGPADSYCSNCGTELRKPRKRPR